MAISRYVYPTGIPGEEAFGSVTCYTLCPGMVVLSGRVNMQLEPLWEVPMTFPVISLTFYRIPYSWSYDHWSPHPISVFVGDF